MRLINITVGGFRNVDDTDIRLGGIVGFVSTNNYGKSNLLEGIKFAFQFIAAGQQDREIMMRDVRNIPLVPSLENKPFRFQVEFDSEVEGPYRFVRYEFSFLWAKDDGSGARIVSETLFANTKASGIFSLYLDREKKKYRASHKTRSFRKIAPQASQLALDALSALDEVELIDVVKRIKSLRFNLASDIDARARFIPSIFELMPPLKEWLNDIPTQLLYLKEHQFEQYRLFEEGVYALFPEFEAISVEVFRNEFKQKLNLNQEREKPLPFQIKDDVVKLMVKSSYLNQVVDIQHMSAGTKRVVWLLANAILTSSRQGQKILAIEEIETSIHPRLIEELLEQLNENLGNSTLLVTSYSPYWVQYLKPNKIYVGLPNENGCACFKPLDAGKFKDFVKRAHDRGLGFGEYLYSLMSGSDDGVRVLRKYLQE